jgi:NADH-quinone oxidoreductase B subunit
MSRFDFLISPPVAFLVFLAIGFLLYVLGNRLAPKLKRGGKPPCLRQDLGDSVRYPVLSSPLLHHDAWLPWSSPPSRAEGRVFGSFISVIFLSIMALTKLDVRENRRWSRKKSPWILHLNSGACNACDIEIVAALTPRFDVERLGVLLKATPRHADVIISTGPVTRQIKDRIIRIYEQTPNPKFVIAVGACAMSGCVYRGAYNIMGGLDQVIPVNIYVPGCPARPDAILDGVVKLLGTL